VAVLAEELGALLGPGALRAGAALEPYRLGRLAPQAATLPGDEAEVARVLRFASEAGLGVVPWGHGTYQGVGLPPARYDLALDLTRLDRLVAHEPADMTATAQAGLSVAVLQSRLAEHGQFLPLDPPLARASTLGGLLATRASGPLRCRYGTARDLVLGLRIAHPDGTVTRAGASVVKNATGYDLPKLHLGAHGTLGVILEATLRLYPRPDLERSWWITAGDALRLQEVAIKILTSHLVPDRVEYADASAARLWGASVEGPALCVSLGGMRESVEGQAADLRRIVEERGAALREVGADVWTRSGDFPWSLPVPAPGACWAIWRAGVVPAESVPALGALRQVASSPSDTAGAATVSHGMLRGIFRGPSAAHVVQTVIAAREALASRGGYLVLLDASPTVREGVDPWGVSPEGLDVMRRMKRAFDPTCVLNPGRFVGGI
jgi:glycolate oxidase FAD binding subunit